MKAHREKDKGNEVGGFTVCAQPLLVIIYLCITVWLKQVHNAIKSCVDPHQNFLGESCVIYEIIIWID